MSSWTFSIRYWWIPITYGNRFMHCLKENSLEPDFKARILNFPTWAIYLTFLCLIYSAIKKGIINVVVGKNTSCWLVILAMIQPILFVLFECFLCWHLVLDWGNSLILYPKQWIQVRWRNKQKTWDVRVQWFRILVSQAVWTFLFLTGYGTRPQALSSKMSLNQNVVTNTCRVNEIKK